MSPPRLLLSAALLLIVPTNGYLNHHPITPLRSKASITPPRCASHAVRLCEPPPLVDESKDEPPPPITLQERLKLFWRLAVPYFEQADNAKLNFALMLLLVL